MACLLCSFHLTTQKPVALLSIPSTFNKHSVGAHYVEGLRFRRCIKPTYTHLEFAFKWGRQAKTFTIQGDEYSNLAVSQVRHRGAKALWANFTEEVVFKEEVGGNSRQIKSYKAPESWGQAQCILKMVSVVQAYNACRWRWRWVYWQVENSSGQHFPIASAPPLWILFSLVDSHFSRLPLKNSFSIV